MDYITLVKGDDTNFVDDQYIKIKFVTDLDFTGFTGYFTLGGVTLNYTNISSKVINVVLNNSFTSALTVGKQYAELKLKDTQNRYRTITSVIPIKVVDVVTVQPTYVNNVIECHSDVNNTTIEVKIETAGIAKSTADEYVTTMNSILTQTQSKANEASSSAVNANTSEVNAKSYMDYAKDYKDLAKTSSDNAATSATFVETTINGFDTHVASKQSDFDSNATSKTNTFNSNATSKTEEFNTNATSKTNDFNTNYNTKKLAIDNAVTQAQRYAIGTPSEPDGYSAKYWAERASQGQIQADWTQDDITKQDYIKNKPALKTVATSGSYNDLDDKPTIPTVLSGFIDDLGNSPVHTHSQYEDTTNKGVANGYAELDNTGKVPTSQLPNTGSGLELCDISMALYVDETKGLRRYLNGQIVDINTNTQAFLNRLLEIKNTNPELFTTESNWQSEALLNIDGCVYKFVLNYSGDNVVSVRLPKYPDYVEINAGGTLPVVGNGMSLGLTNGTENVGLQNYVGSYNWNLNVSRKAYGTNVGSAYITGSDSSQGCYGITTDPTKSGIQTTLKQTKLKMRYFIQIATGSETENNIINDIELNNPYSLFDSKYSDHELNNLSWLKSEGQWNAKTVYTDAYDKLLKVYNGTETVEGLSVKLSTETYTDYDFVLNTTDETFRLPLLDGSEDLLSDRYDDLELLASGSTYTAPANGWFFLRKFTSASNQFIGLYQTNNNGVSSEITNSLANFDSSIFIPVRKGHVVACYYSFGGETKEFRFIYAKGNGSLYFYVGETVQNANIIDAGRIGEQVANCITRNDCKAYVTETYVNGTSGYRTWSDGYCEQWGKATKPSTALTISLLKTYYSNNYNIQVLPNTSSSSVNCSVRGIPSTSSFTISYSESPNNGFYWQTCGYIA